MSHLGVNDSCYLLVLCSTRHPDSIDPFGLLPLGGAVGSRPNSYYVLPLVGNVISRTEHPWSGDLAYFICC